MRLHISPYTYVDALLWLQVEVEGVVKTVVLRPFQVNKIGHPHYRRKGGGGGVESRVLDGVG